MTPAEVVAPETRLESLTLDELDELQNLTGGADPTAGDFWDNLKALRAFAYLFTRRDQPALTWEETGAWTLAEVYAVFGRVPEVDPSPPTAAGNGSESPTRSELTRARSVG
jgi:hypothetical protein